jgi:hypothetical protein
MSHLRDAASWIWPGRASWRCSFAGRGIGASETADKDSAKAPAHDAGTSSERRPVCEPEKEPRRTRRE